MIAMRRSLMTAALGGAAAMLPAGAGAQVETIPALTVTAGGAYSTSPFLQAGGNGGNGGGAFSTQLDIRPSLTLLGGTETAVISGTYNRADYFSRFGSNSGYGVGINANKRLNPRATIGATAAFDSSILGANNGFITPGNLLQPIVPGLGTGTGVGTVPGTDIGTGTGAGTGGVIGTSPIGTLPTTPVIDPSGVNGDIGLIGARQRRNALSAGVTGSYILSPRSSINGGLNVARSTYPGSNPANLLASDFTSYNGNFGYSRTLTELSSIGFQVSASYSKFAAGFNTQIYTPRITYSRTLSERWTLSAGVGAGVTRQLNQTRTILSVDASLCRSTSERTRGCLTAARVPTVSGIGGARVQSNVGLTFSRQFDENWSGAVSGNYSHVSAALNGVSPILSLGAQDLFNSDVSVARRLGRRLSAVGGVGYRRGNSIGNRTANDVTARLGLTLSMGRFQ